MDQVFGTKAKQLQNILKKCFKLSLQVAVEALLLVANRVYL